MTRTDRSRAQRRRRQLIDVLSAAALANAPDVMVQLAKADPAPLEAWRGRKELLLQANRQQQGRLQQQALCLQKASSMAEVQQCGSVMLPGSMHGPGMGNCGWGMPMW